MTYPEEYIEKSYDFGRNFVTRRSLHWNFVSQEFAETSLFKNGLLVIQLLLLLFFLFKRWIDYKTMFKDLRIWPLKIFPKFQPIDSYYVAEVFFL